MAESSIRDEKGRKAKTKCKMCKQSEAPLVPPLVPGQDRLCPKCSLGRQLKIQGDKLSPEEITETQEKAKGVIELMMNLGVTKQNEDEPGKFEPTNVDVQVIEALAPDLCKVLRKGSLRQFHSLLHPVHYKINEKWNFRGTLFDVFCSHKKNLSEYSDQKQRAHVLVQEILKRKSKTVYLLDGHGRMLLSIIHALIVSEIDPDSIHFVVVDNDRECHCFHTHFFPSKVECRHGNILDIDLNKTKTDMLYLNFCSIPSRTSYDILFNKEEVLKWVWERMRTMECGIMISTVIRDTRSENDREDGVITAVGPRKGKNTTDYHLLSFGFGSYLSESKLFRAGIVSTRPPRARDQPENPALEFVTWLITPEDCQARKKPDLLANWFEDEGITWDYHTEFRPGAEIRVKTGKNKTPGDQNDVVKERTAMWVILERDDREVRIQNLAEVNDQLELIKESDWHSWNCSSDEDEKEDGRDEESSSEISEVPNTGNED